MQPQGFLRNPLTAWIAPALAFWAILILVDGSQDLEPQRSPASRPGANKVHATTTAEQPPNAFPNALRIPLVVEDSDSYCNLGINNLGESPATLKI